MKPTFSEWYHTVFDLEELHQTDLSVEPLEQEYESEKILHNKDDVNLRLKLALGVIKIHNVAGRRGHEREGTIDICHGDAKVD
jgi:hypothetical protein